MTACCKKRCCCEDEDEDESEKYEFSYLADRMEKIVSKLEISIELLRTSLSVMSSPAFDMNKFDEYLKNNADNLSNAINTRMVKIQEMYISMFEQFDERIQSFEKKTNIV